jgi:dipeptidyl aminopeptidase/acylaminoacyl peptidase
MKRVFAADSTKRIASVQLLSNRKTALVTLRREGPERRIGVLDLGSGVVRELGAGFAPHYAMGQLLFADLEGRLYTQPFDVGRMALTGTARQISDMVGGNFFSVPLFDVSPTGSIVYRANPGGTFTLSIVDRAGQRLLALPGHRPWGPRFSPDGRRVAYAAVARDQTRSDIWIADLESGTTQRFTTDGNENDDAQWSPDGRVIVYSADAEGGKDMFQQRLDGGAPRPVLRRPGDQWPSDWSGIGNLLLFTEVKADVSMGVWVQPLDSGAPRAYVDEPSNEKGGRLSPNGKWVAYTSDETGQEEIYLQPFPTPGPRTVVSVGGGVDPVWRGDSQELYYFRGDQLIAVSLVPGAPGQPLIVRSRTPLFVTPYVHFANANYDVSPDGKRFVLLGESGRGNRVVVWLHALDALAESRAPDEQRP